MTEALLVLAAVTESIVRTIYAGLDGQTTLALSLLALGTTMPLSYLRPAGAAVAISICSVLSLAAFHLITIAGCAAQLIACYQLSRSDSPAKLAAAGLVVPFLVLALAGPTQTDTRVLIVLLAALVPVAAWAGITVQAQAEAAENDTARQVITGTLLDHTARGERARIARELHDVVAHHISMIAVQAETARLTTPGMPATGAQRLSAIGDTARAALTEMRRLLGVLREDARTSEQPNIVTNRQPLPGLDQLGALLDEARDAAGTGIRLILSGSPQRLDPGVELAAYRIVQEALTNARRHAPGAAVDVELQYSTDTLRLRIRDNGPGPPATTAAGHGQLGMSERAAAVGGRLSTRRASGGGFLVETHLPAQSESPP